MPWQGHTIAKGRKPAKAKYKLNEDVRENYLDIECTVLYLSYKQARKVIHRSIGGVCMDCMSFLHGQKTSDVPYSFEYKGRFYALMKEDWAHTIHGEYWDLEFLIDDLNLNHPRLR